MVLHTAGALHIVITMHNIKPLCVCICVSVSVGYEYESCPGVVQWERRTALMQGFELVPSNLGGWSLDKHHTLNIRSGEDECKPHKQGCLFSVHGDKPSPLVSDP